MLKKRVYYKIGERKLNTWRLFIHNSNKRAYLLGAGIILPAILAMPFVAPRSDNNADRRSVAEAGGTADMQSPQLEPTPDKKPKASQTKSSDAVVKVASPEQPMPAPQEAVATPEVVPVPAPVPPAIPPPVAPVEVPAPVVEAPPSEHPVRHAALLEVIAKGESSGNYNAYFAKAKNTEIRFTEMSLGQVMEWQAEHVKKGAKSNAVGKYQIIRPTLQELIQKLSINTAELYNEAMQDRLAVALLEKRGMTSYMDKKISREQFAANLAKEWATLPKITGTNPTESYYAGDGLNKSGVTVDELYGALDGFGG